MSGSRNLFTGYASREIRSPRGLARFAFDWAQQHVPSRFDLLVLRPLEFELSALISDVRYQWLADRCIEGGRKINLWMQRAPFSPRLKAVRYSDHTPVTLLHKSDLYRDILKQAHIEYGAATGAWSHNTLLASLRLLRTRQQGDFTDREMDCLRRWQPLFTQAVLSLAQYQEHQLARRSIKKFIWSLPTAFVVLDWNFRIQFHNFAAIQICHWWRHGARAAFMKTPAVFTIPEDILLTVRQMKARIQDAATSLPISVELSAPHGSETHQLYVRIDYEPSNSFAFSRGFFRLHWQEATRQHSDADTFQRIKRLTRRERDCVHLLSTGKGPPEIATILGTSYGTVRNKLSGIYQKLGFSGQVELATFFARHPESLSIRPDDTPRWTSDF